MRPLNIVYGGHATYEALRDNIEMLKPVLVDVGFKVNESAEFDDDAINVVYEGHHPRYWEEIRAKISKCDKKNLFMICTEEVVGSRFLPRSFFTFNNFKILSAGPVRRFFRPIELAIFQLRFRNTKYLEEKEKEKELKPGAIYDYYLKQRFPLIYNFLKRISLEHNEKIWKERYDFFHSIIGNFKGIISTYDKHYGRYGFDNFLYLPHLFVDADLEIENAQDLPKKYDCLFTGGMTNHRKTVLDDLGERFNCKSSGIASDEERAKRFAQTTVILGLLKEKNQYTSSTNRTFYCLKNNHLIVNERPKKPDYLDEYVPTVPTAELANTIASILENYKTYHSQFISKRKEAIQRWNAKNYKNILIKHLSD